MTIGEITSIVVGCIVSLLFYLLKNKVDRMEDDTKENAKQTKEIVENYLSRFEKVYSTMNRSEREITKHIYDSKTEILLEISKINGHRK